MLWSKMLKLLPTAAQVGEPLNQLNEMLVDPDLANVRSELRVIREEYKVSANYTWPELGPNLVMREEYGVWSTRCEECYAPMTPLQAGTKKPGLFGLPMIKNPLREISETIGVEWKD